MWTKQQQALLPTRAAHGRLHRNRDAVAWRFSTLCRVSGPTLFQMTFTAALWVAVFGKCGPPPDLPYALPASEMNQTDFESYTNLKYNCRPGYSRASSTQTIFCRPSGEWKISISCVSKYQHLFFSLVQLSVLKSCLRLYNYCIFKSLRN